MVGLAIGRESKIQECACALGCTIGDDGIVVMSDGLHHLLQVTSTSLAKCVECNNKRNTSVTIACCTGVRPFQFNRLLECR